MPPPINRLFHGYSAVMELPVKRYLDGELTEKELYDEFDKIFKETKKHFDKILAKKGLI